MLPTVFATLAVAQAGGAPEITIYNQGFALVKEVRRLDLREGRQQVRVEDVAALIEPNSVGVRRLRGAGDFVLLEQNYQYDLINPIAILNKAVGQRVRFLRLLENGQKDVVEGTLLSSPTAIVNPAGEGAQATYNGLVIRTDDGRILLNPSGEIEVMQLPEGMISKPTLVWDLDAKAGAAEVELSYLTRGMTWSADYVLTLDGAGKGDLIGWVTLNNASGVTFRDAKLKLLAGDVQRAQPEGMGVRGGVGGAMPMMAKAADQFQQEELFEYHLYTLQRPATVRDKETKQIQLLAGGGIPVEKKLIVDALRPFGRYFPSEGEFGTGNLKPQVRVEFVNSEKSGLGMPLPKGTVKVYQRDSSGSVQMLGEDSIDHTPKDERVSLVVGRSFDVVAERRRTNFRRLGPSTVEESFEIELRNRKSTPETVHVYERRYGDWRVTEKSQDFVKLDANTIDFVVQLKAGETRKVAYTVVTSW
ncbi:MAG: hypothetical protein N2109_11765 [Fimbriimonadales bacterium]|nr:hypothetical protein [Fimbriimonadales bacterium]